MGPILEGEIVQILINCGCAQYALKFAGLTTEKFFMYTPEDLMRLLPADGGREELAQKIFADIQKEKRNKESQKSGQNDEEEDVQIVEVITRTEAQVAVVKEEIIDEDDYDNQEDQCSTAPSSPIEDLNLQYTDGSSEESDNEREFITLNLNDLRSGFQNLMHDERAHVTLLGHQGVHKCTENHPNAAVLDEWTDGLAIWGLHIRSLKLTTWTWKDLSSPCPWNLFNILSKQCLFLKELSIEANISDASKNDQVPEFPDNFKLSKLKILRIHHDENINYKKQLKEIFLAATNLREIYFSYGTLISVNTFLHILCNLARRQIEHLKILSVKSYDERGCLTEAQFVKLSKLKAVSLEVLELGHGLWEDVKGSTVKDVLCRFSKTLKKIKILGSFQGNNELKPTILIEFPPMANLRHVDIGGNYVYNSVTEDSRSIAGDKSGPKFRKGLQGQRMNVSVSSKVSSFSVSLQFPLLPKLEHLELGNLFNINDLHFASFPKLTVFYVASRWDLTVVFPPLDKNTRRSTYPLVTNLQLPDCLDDVSFVKLIPKRFPNIIYCDIILASVMVLRSFFCAMADSKLEKLDITSQFFFESTLDTCLLDHPSEVVQSQEEIEKIRLLKEYGHWGDFVKYHKIQLPPEHFSNLEREDLAGLSSLSKITHFCLDHRPRVLAIPKGHLHWTDPNCEFTEEFIGFRRYPWSAECEVLRNNIMKSLQDDRYLNYNNPGRSYYPWMSSIFYRRNLNVVQKHNKKFCLLCFCTTFKLRR